MGTSIIEKTVFWTVITLLCLSSVIVGVESQCTSRVVAGIKVSDEATLRKYAGTANAPNIIICADIRITSTIKVNQSIAIVGGCPYPGCRIYSTGQIDTGVRLFDVSSGTGNVTFQDLWLDGGYAQPSNNSKVKVCQVPVEDYSNYNGGAINSGGQTTLTLDSVIFTSNTACVGGGAVQVGGDASVTNCLFLNNTAIYGAGLNFNDAAVLVIENCNFTSNKAIDRGSAVRMYQPASASVRGCLFMYNVATGYGGGALVVFSEPTRLVYNNQILVAGNTFGNNTSYVQGGAYLSIYSGFNVIVGNSFAGNYAPSGGAVALDNSAAAITGPNDFAANLADSPARGNNIYVLGSSTRTVTTTCPTLDDTIVTPGPGGAKQSSCVEVTCDVNNPCHPLATCTVINALPTCTCPKSAPGNGWMCGSVGLLDVGAGVPLAPLVFINLTYDPLAANISTFIGPSLSGAAVSQPKAAISPSTVSTSGAPPPTSVNITPLPVPSSSRDSQSSSNIGVIVGAVLGMGAAVLLGVALLVYCFCKRRGKKRGRALPPDDLEAEASRRALSSQGMPSGREAFSDKALGRSGRRFTYDEISDATNNFSREALLGAGAFGKVYLATMADGGQLAVKHLKDGTKGMGESEFLAELDALGSVRHRNLVALRGYCITASECFLVLDYAANGNLDTALRARDKPPLDWATRVNIAAGTARGLSYLHNDLSAPLIHRDVKSANILLDAKMQAQVADFGMARLIGNDNAYETTLVRGTYGYMAPEYALSGRVTVKSDVYSFGVVLLELVTGFRALETGPTGKKANLVEAVMRNQHQLMVIMDPKLENRYPPKEAERLIRVALACVDRDDKRRPDMADVVHELASLAKGGPSTGLGQAASRPMDDSDDGQTEWFVPRGQTAASNASESSQSSFGLSQVSWSLGGTSSETSVAYQMSMIREGR